MTHNISQAQNHLQVPGGDACGGSSLELCQNTRKRVIDLWAASEVQRKNQLAQTRLALATTCN